MARIISGQHPTMNRQRDKAFFLNWWLLLRPHTLTAAVMPVLIGTSMAVVEGKFKLLLFATMLLASVLIQSAVNMFNEYFDFRRGLDTVDSVGIGGSIVRGEMHERAVLKTATTFFAISILLGSYICAATSWWVAVIGSASMLVGYFYSGGPSPIAYTPAGEIAAGIFMGPVIVLIAYFVQAGSVTMRSVLMSVPISILVAAIMLANNIRDAKRDGAKGRKTIAIRLGQSKAIGLLGLLFTLSFLWTAVMAITGLATLWILISLACIPKAVQSIKIFRRGGTPLDMMPAMKATSILHSQFGILFSAGLLVGRLLPLV